MIVAGIFDDISSATEAIKAIGQWFANAASWIYSPIQWLIDWWPLLGHFAIFAIVIILCGFIARFLPDKAKLWLLILLGFAGAFISGEVNQYRKRLTADRERKKVLEKAKPRAKPPSDQDQWKWPT